MPRPSVGDIIRLSDLLPLFDLLDNNTSKGYIGQIIAFPSNIVPNGTFLCDGSEISRTTYSELFNVIGTTYGEGDGSTTFNIPDYRGAFLRCIGGNADELGVLQEDAIRNITGKLGYPVDGWSSYAEGIFIGTPKAASSASNLRGTQQGNITYSRVEIDLSTQIPVASEIRPINYAINICIIYE